MASARLAEAERASSGSLLATQRPNHLFDVFAAVADVDVSHPFVHETGGPGRGHHRLVVSLGQQFDAAKSAALEQPARGGLQRPGRETAASVLRSHPDVELGGSPLPVDVVDRDPTPARVGAALEDRQSDPPTPLALPIGPLGHPPKLGAARRPRLAESLAQVWIVLVGDQDLWDIALGCKTEPDGPVLERLG